MGALILAPVDIGSQIGKTPVVQVVDGQQRLTTFQLFLVALREVARRHEFADFLPQVNAYLFNNPKGKDSDVSAKYKLTPTPSDREIFQDLLELDYQTIILKHKGLFWGSGVPKNTQYPAFRAYVLFYEWIEMFTLTGPSEEGQINEDGLTLGEPEPGNRESVEERLEALLNAVLDRLKLVVISLNENDDAQVIFETLNSMGEPLLAMDLVRNNIFHRAGGTGPQVDVLYKKFWDPLDEPWWREAAPNARPMRPRIDHFLSSVLAAESGQQVSMRELYAEYRAYALPKGKPRFPNVEDELKLLQRYAPLYETLEGRSSVDRSLAWFGRKMSAWQVTTVYPVALQLGAPSVSESTREAVCLALYSYIVRRALCGLTTKNLNNVFYGLAAKFQAEGPSVTALKDFFGERLGDSIRFPDDAELSASIAMKDAYSISPQPRLVDILWELEVASWSHMSEKHAKPDSLWVEHVMPRTWTEKWPFSEAEYAEPLSGAEHAVSRASAINTLGNLTLITDRLNMSVSNKSFTDKQKKFFAHSTLFLNKWFAGHQRWTEAEIKARSQHLAGLARHVWPNLTRIGV